MLSKIRLYLKRKAGLPKIRRIFAVKFSANMEWLKELIWGSSVAHTVLVYSLVVAIGVALGKIKVFGVSLGITFVLFAGIALGHYGFAVNHDVLEFVKDFGLILFVFAIGLQVGPGFFSSFKKGGIRLNFLAMIIVLLGGLTTLVIHFITGMPLSVMVGVMSGAVTNTPGLGAAQEALKQVGADPATGDIPDIGLGYAVAYPLGVLGIIFTMLLLRKVSHISLSGELKAFEQKQHPADSLPEKVCIKVKNPDFVNKTILQISRMIHSEVVISRILHDGEVYAPSSGSVVFEDDVLLVVAKKGLLDALVDKMGIRSDINIGGATGKLISTQVLVTKRAVIGKDLGSLKLRNRYNINITRVYRSGIEFIALPEMKLQMGDKLTIVGEEAVVSKVAEELGNSIKRLNDPNIIPLFIGILLGVLFGSIPFMIPGMPNPIKLGLAGGPLIIAILLSRYGYRFSLTSYTTPSANLMLRELGIVLFLASIGLKSGEKFIPTLLSGDGLIWMGYGVIITLVPILLVSFFSRWVLKMNYFEICGLLSGSMTDPPALAYANGIAQSEAPAIAYATVYPLVMFLRILVPQLMILMFL